MACGFTGNSDIFGIGIRIGYYTQVVAVWFSSYFYFREAKSLRAVNNLFLLALIIVGCIFFINARSTYVVHAFLLLQVGIVIGLVGITETARYGTKYRETSRERLLLMAIMIFGAFFSVCFWWKGMDIMLPTPCGTYTFFFWRVGFVGWLRTLMKISSLFAATWTAPSHISRDAATLVFDLRMRNTRASFINAVTAAGNVSKPSGALDRERNKERPIDTLEPQLSTSRHSQSLKLAVFEKGFGVLRGSISSHSISLAKKTENTRTLKREFDAERAILEGVDKAQVYCDLLMSIYPQNSALRGKRRIDRLKFNIPHQKTQCSDPIPYLQCIFGALRSIWTNKPSTSIRQGVSLHLIAMGAIAPWQWPRIMNRMYELDQSSKTPDWHHFTIASDLQQSQIATAPNSTAKWAFAATQQFIFIALLIAQIELTLVWNDVSGLQSLSSLGQLIPFILGVGGLIKVLWGKARLVWWESKGIAEGREGRAGEYEVAMARYWERKNERLDRPILRAATA